MIPFLHSTAQELKDSTQEAITEALKQLGMISALASYDDVTRTGRITARPIVDSIEADYHLDGKPFVLRRVIDGYLRFYMVGKDSSDTTPL